MGDAIQIETCHSGEGQNPDTTLPWIPAYAGMTLIERIQIVMRQLVSKREGTYTPSLKISSP